MTNVISVREQTYDDNELCKSEIGKPRQAANEVAVFCNRSESTKIVHRSQNTDTHHFALPEYILDAEQVWRHAGDLPIEYGRVARVRARESTETPCKR